MSRRKLVLTCLLLFLTSVIIVCEYLIYYIVLMQCGWPELDQSSVEETVTTKSEEDLRVLLLADTHLLGSRKGHWFDKLRREWQMHRAFQTAVTLHRPHVVFFLGDLFDEGLWCSDSEFSSTIQRFYSLFRVPKGVKTFVVVGNHDVGFHYWITPYLQDRFVQGFNSPSVQMVTLFGNHFILINSMAMEGDGCHLCSSAQIHINELSRKLNCSRAPGKCAKKDHLPYSRPILLQHFPMYRESDEQCSELDEAPEDVKKQKFREKWDCLSKQSSNMLLDSLSPRLVVTGHTHHGCSVYHSKHRTHEYTVPSFSWRNKDNPSFLLAVIRPNNYAVSKCMMPRESTVLMMYLCGFIACLLIASLALRFNRRNRLFKIN